MSECDARKATFHPLIEIERNLDTKIDLKVKAQETAALTTTCIPGRPFYTKKCYVYNVHTSTMQTLTITVLVTRLHYIVLHTTLEFGEKLILFTEPGTVPKFSQTFINYHRYIFLHKYRWSISPHQTSC